MSANADDVRRQLEGLPGLGRDLRAGIQQALTIAELDAEMALTRARKVLEYVVRDLYEAQVAEPPGTRPLENLLQRLVKDGHLPKRLAAYANTVRELGNVGTHGFGEQVTSADVLQSLGQLLPILQWYGESQGRGDAASLAGPGPVPAEPERVARSRVVPKGLRAFDAWDSEFFLDLVPGPRDRDGLPESIRFWKDRVERAAELPFTVGLLYGPSGCGKSSLLRAGLLPRLAAQVLPVYVEAAADDTEARLLSGLRKRCPNLSPEATLTASLTALRTGPGLPAGAKVLLVLDQFEQWLHAHRGQADTELVQALRQCDGQHSQCLVLVRDDFWLAVSRFFQEVNIPLVQGQNAALVDLFDLLHARKVLAEFGRAFGRLPEDLDRLTPEQQGFLDEAVASLAQENKVISVRLALFAEMVKNRPWTPATLKAIGGTEGVGVTFLEETFSAATAPAEHRLHQQAAQAVLKALLPEAGSDIKGARRSRQELLAACGFAERPRDFTDLLRILDTELRLVTPTEEETPAAIPACGFAQYYQLTHDYLVPSLRTWLTRKQKETRRGRAELRLAERASLWNSKPESRHLPAWWEWLNIRCFTQTKDWTAPQRRMMRRARRFHALRGAGLFVLLAVFTFTGLMIRDAVVEQQRATHAAGLVRSLLDADTAQVPALVAELDDYRTWADPLLRQEHDRAEKSSRQRLHTSLALLPVDATHTDELLARLLEAAPAEVPVLRDALFDHRETLGERLWTAAEKPPTGREGQRLRAAAALARHDPDSPRWNAVAGPLVGQLVAENPVYLAHWRDAFWPVKDRLLTALAAVYRDPGEARRTLATNVLADFAADRPELLADLVLDADAQQFARLSPRLEAYRAEAQALFRSELARQPQPGPWADPPLDPAWKTPDAALVRQIEAAHGLVAERFAFCQTLPLEEFLKVAEALRPCGYRPLRCRPYPVATSGPLAATVLWTRDGGGWQAALGLTAEQLEQQDAERAKLGWHVAEVAGYLTGQEERFAVVWTKAAAKQQARWFVRQSSRQHRQTEQAMQKAELQPVTLQAYVGPSGELRYCSVWRSGLPRSEGFWEDDEGTFADRALSEGLPIDVSLTPSRFVEQELLAWLTGSPWAGLARRAETLATPHPERHYAGVFQGSAQFDAVQVLGLTAEKQLERARELLAQGYRPAAISVCSWLQAARLQAQPTSEPLVATFWHRPIVPDAAKEHLAKRQANAAVALLKLGSAADAWPLLKHRADPRARSYLIHRLSPLGAEPKALWRRFEEEPDVSIRRALLLALGEFGESELPRDQRASLLPNLLELYRGDPDAGLHGAIAWLLRQWGQREKIKEMDGELAQRGDPCAAGTSTARGRRLWSCPARSNS